jgi:hypothetical protein
LKGSSGPAFLHPTLETAQRLCGIEQFVNMTAKRAATTEDSFDKRIYRNASGDLDLQ